ncbi:DUF4339 domain-containing protein [Cerasicoccus fimbriatus]|uniref:DUF4339 domain-containing protein n=1 Tax=Cerasicoccus fimbriatus TaxID=3014554 RepID=UPI0022B4B834|nr:DUF4339 domain-containing protein [Cerasicoccus sp. TK19100]
MSWYYVHNGETVGPVTQEEFDELRYSGVLNDQTMVWQDGWTEWMPLGQANLAPVASPAAPAAGLKLGQKRAPMESYQQPTVEASHAQEVPVNTEEIAAGIPLEFEEDAAQFVSGARWFYWIAAFSVINSVIAFFQGGVYFVIGLAYTQIVDLIAFSLEPEIGNIALIVGLVINLVISGVFALFGLFSLKGIRALMVCGIGLYVIDGLIFLLSADWLSVAFHGYASFCLIRGFISLNTLKKAGVKVA